MEVDLQAVQSFAASLDTEEILDAANAELRLPLQFDGIESEVNLLTLMHLLCFGSGYEGMLQDACKIGWQECMQFGVLGMHISGRKLDAEYLGRFSDLQVNNFFRIPTHEDVPSEMHPAIQVSQPGVLMPLARSVRQQLQQLGTALAEGGHASAGECVLKILEEAKQHTGPCAAAVVEKLGAFITGFLDEADGDAGKVQFYSKAQALVSHLHQRFKADDSQMFGFRDAGMMTASADSVLPSVLRALGVIQVTGAADDSLRSGSDSTGAEWVPAFRAAAVVAVDAIASVLNLANGSAAITARQLDAYIRTVELKKLSGSGGAGIEMLVAKDTVHF